MGQLYEHCSVELTGLIEVIYNNQFENVCHGETHNR